MQVNQTIKSSLDKLCYVSVLFSCLLFFVICINTPEHNWDMLGYAASVVTFEEQDPNKIHNHVYSELKSYASEKDFNSLTRDGKYRETMFADPDAFVQQVPYYKIRILFVGLILMLTKFGVNIFSACHLITAAGTAFGLLVFYHAYKDVIKPVYFRALFPLIFILCDAIDAGQRVTPDTLAFLWLGLISWAFIKKHWSLYPLLVFSVLVRTDLIVYVMLTFVFVFLFWSSERRRVCISTIAVLILYFSVNNMIGNYGWSTVFYFVFISNMQATHPQEFANIGFSFAQYFDAVVKNSINIIYENVFWLFVLNVLLQLIIFMKMENIKKLGWEQLLKLTANPVIMLTLTSCAYIAAHYILFPALWSRFFIGQYMVGALGLLYVLGRVAESKNA